MRYTFLLIICASLLLNGCSRKDDFKENNLVPQIEFNTPDNLLRVSHIQDTIKVNGLYYINVFVIDEEELKPLFLFENDTIPIAQTYQDYPIHYSSLPNNDSTYEFHISSGGNYTIDVVAEDSYGGQWYSSFDLLVLSNLVPIVRFEVKNTGLLDPLEITIDASETFDPDSRWGGRVVMYEYSINSNPVIQTELSKITYIVSGPGNYSIAVRAMDNDGAWSEYSYDYINVTE